MTRTLVLLAVCSLSHPLSAQSTQIAVAVGERVRVATSTAPSRRVVGTLVQLTRDSLIILAHPPHNLDPTREAFSITNVRSIEVKRPSRTRAMLGGAFLGSVVGAVTAAVGISASSADSGEQMFGGVIVAAAGAVGAVLGGVIGYVVDRAGWTEVFP